MDLSKRQAEKLVKGCINNDRTAQETLYKTFYADMLRVCYNYLRDKELAKEAFNTGFLKVFQSIQNFDIEKGELGGWIRKIMIYTAIDLCRKELKFTTGHLDVQDQDDFFYFSFCFGKIILRGYPAAHQGITICNANCFQFVGIGWLYT